VPYHLVYGNRLPRSGSRKHSKPELTATMARILVAGESWQVFSTHTKGSTPSSPRTTARGSQTSARRSSRRDTSSNSNRNHVAAAKFPDTDTALNEFDAVVLSDIGSNTLLIPSATFMRAEPRPNRLVALRNWVANGGGLAMIGGYLSFQGIEGKANYRATPLAEVLPVELELGDDRQEAPQGAVAHLTETGHPVTAGISGEWPTLLGFQRLVAKQDSQVLATIDGWPLLVVGRFGKGRVLAFASTWGLIGLLPASPSGRATPGCGGKRPPGSPGLQDGARVMASPCADASSRCQLACGKPAVPR